MQKIKPIILAAGKGTRIAEYTEKTYGEAIPKVMLTLNKRPLLDYILTTLGKAGFPKPIVVVGFMQDKVRSYFGDRAIYIEQKEQLGTGHAVMVCEKAIPQADNFLVLYGDMPFWSRETLKSISQIHQEENSILTIGTIKLVNPIFWAYGRIIRDQSNQIIGVVEQKDATESEKEIKECWPGILCAQSNWLWPALKKIKNENSQKEYYLNSLAPIAVAEKLAISSFSVKNDYETLGINTLEQYEQAKIALKVYENLQNPSDNS